MRPTCLMSPVPAMPITRVEKIKGAIIDLIRLRNRIERGRSAIPHSGMILPSTMPRTRPIMIFQVRDIFGNRKAILYCSSNAYVAVFAALHQRRAGLEAYSILKTSLAIDLALEGCRGAAVWTFCEFH